MVLDGNAKYDIDFSKIIEIIDNTVTDLGKKKLLYILENPIDDPTMLNRRHACIEKFIQNTKCDVPNLLQIIHECHDALHWFFDKNAPEKDWIETTYIPKLASLLFQNDPLICHSYVAYKTLIGPLIAIIAPIMYVIIPFLYITIVYKIPIKFSMFLQIFSKIMFSSRSNTELIIILISVIVYLQGVASSVETAMLYIKVNKFLWKKYYDVTQYIDAATKLAKIFDGVDFEAFGRDRNNKWDVSKIPMIYNDFSMFSYIGHILSHVQNFDINSVKGLISQVTYIEVVYSIITAKNKFNLSYSRMMLNTEYPYIKAKGMYHIAIPEDVVIKNDIEIGGVEIPNNVILTGPNAAGKSSFLKSLIVNTILSQSICMSACDLFVYTPFHSISTHMNIPDVNGKASLFEAEMKRCKDKLDVVKNIPRSKFVLYAMDEVFNSTQPIEGVAGAHAILRRFATYRNTIGLISTHFIELTNLANVEDFENYKMVAEHNEDTGDICFPYKLQRGVSNQHIALELLAREGFDKSIINEAISTRKMLVCSKSEE